MLYRLVLLAALVAAAPLLGPIRAHAQQGASASQSSTQEDEDARDEDEDDRPRTPNSGIRYGLRIQGFAQFGLLGQVKLRPNVDDVGHIHFSYGGELRMTYPVAKYLVAGGSFGFRRFRTDASEADTDGDRRNDYGRSTFLQATAILQPRIPITLRNGKLLELAITIPIGMGILSPSRNWDVITGGAGLAFGGLGSIQYFIAPRLSWTFEAGWVHQITWHGVNMSDDPERTRMSAGQLVLRIGLGLRI